MSKIKTKQIDAFIAAPVVVSDFASANGASNNVTTAVATVLATASNSGGAVDVVNASSYNTPGIVVGTTYKVRLIRSNTKKVITTSDGFEIYGKLTYSSPTYTLTYYYTNSSGVETTTSITGPITINFIFYYQFKLKDLPVNSLTDMREFFNNGVPVIANDMTGTVGGYFLTTNASTKKAESVYAFNATSIPFSSVNYVATDVASALDEIALSPLPTIISQDIKLANGYIYTSQNGVGNLNTRYGGVNSQTYVGSALVATEGWFLATPTYAELAFGDIADSNRIRFRVNSSSALLNSNSITLGFNQEFYLVNNAGANVITSDVDRLAIGIGSRNVEFDTAVVNTVALAGDYNGYLIDQSNSLYTPNKIYMINTAGTFATQLLSAATSNITLSLPVVTSDLAGVTTASANYLPVFDSSGDAIFTVSLISQDASTQEIGVNTAPLNDYIFSVEAFNAVGTQYAGYFNAVSGLATNNYALKLNAQNAVTANYALAIDNGDYYHQNGFIGIGVTPTTTEKVNIEITTEENALKINSTTPGSTVQRGVYSLLSGVNTTNIAGYFSASNATNNYALIAASGQSVFGATSATTPDALVEFTSTTKGIVLPRMTTVQRNAIVTPVDGMIVYDTSLNAFYGYMNSTWDLIGNDVLSNPYNNDIILGSTYKFNAELYEVEDTGSTFKGSISTNTLTNDRSFRLPDVGITFSGVTSAKTANSIAKFESNGISLADTILSETGGKLTVSGTVDNLAGVVSATDSSTVRTSYNEYKLTSNLSNDISASLNIGHLSDQTASNATHIVYGSINTAYWDQTTAAISLTSENGLVGSTGIVFLNGNGTVDNAAGFRASLRSSAAATVDIYSGFKATVSGTALLGTLNEFRGFNMPDISAFPNVPVASSRYGLYLEDPGVNYIAGTIGVGTSTADVSAVLDLTSTTLGFLPPRMTTAEKNAIGTPADGLVVFDITLQKLCVYTSTGPGWETITSA